MESLGSVPHHIGDPTIWGISTSVPHLSFRAALSSEALDGELACPGQGFRVFWVLGVRGLGFIGV